MVYCIQLRSYVSDYRIRIFDVAFLADEVIERFTSDFKLVARFFKRKRLGQLEDFRKDGKIPIKHVEAVLDLFRVFTGDERYKEAYFAEIRQRAEKGECVTMCSVIDYYEQKGLKQGLERGRTEMLISLVLDGDLSEEKAAKKAKLSLQEFKTLLSETR